MRFTCNQQTLSKALNTVSKAVTTKTTIPILKGILLKVTDEGKLTLSASDLDLSIEKTIDVNNAEAGSAVVMARLFGDIVRKLPNEELIIEEGEKGIISIKSSFSEFKIVGISSDEFPSINEIENETDTLSIEKEVFKSMVRKTAFSASIDESKGVIVGALLEIKKDSLNMVALDGFRMAVCREKMKNEKERNIIIAAKILNEVNKIISDIEEEEYIKFIISDKKAMILLENTKIVIRLLEGEFIKYKDIIPKEHKCRIKINKGAMLESIERASLLAKEGKNNLIKLKLEEDRMIITSRSEEGNVREELSIEKDGNDLEIGFNSKYVIDVLKVVDDEEVILDFNTNVNPCLVKSVEGDNFEYLILPVRINSAS